MPIYVCDTIGDGSEANPIFCPVWEPPRSGWISLVPPGATSGKGLLYLPTPSSDSRLIEVASDPSETLNTGSKRRWGNALGLTFDASVVRDILAELLIAHARSDRWTGLLPTARGRLEIWLGEFGRIWSQPVIKGGASFTESWPTDSTDISTGQDQPWTETSGLEVSGGVLRADNTGTGTTNNALCDTLYDTQNQKHSCTLTSTDGGASINQAQIGVRCQTTSPDDNKYFSQARRDNTKQRFTGKRVAASQTQFYLDTTDPGSPITFAAEMDGSTFTGTFGAFTRSDTDASPELTANRRAYIRIISQSGVGNVTVDNHTMEDVSVAEKRRDMALMGVGR